MTGSLNNRDGRVQEISQITQGLKAIAKELGVPVVALSQLSRQVEQRDDHKPQLADLRESGSIEQDADIVMFLYREEYYSREEGTDTGKVELSIAKNRQGATTNKPISLSFNKQCSYFENMRAYDYDEMDDYDKQAIEKFAELIVKECVTIMTDASDSKLRLSDAIWNTKVHFGVEE